MGEFEAFFVYDKEKKYNFTYEDTDQKNIFNGINIKGIEVLQNKKRENIKISGKIPIKSEQEYKFSTNVEKIIR